MREGGYLVICMVIIAGAIVISGCTTGPGPATLQPTASPTASQEVITVATVVTQPQSAPSSETATPTATIQQIGPVTLDLTAKNFAFNQEIITVPAGAEVTVNFDNQDSGIPHNFAVYEDNTAEKVIYRGEIINGPRSITYMFTAPSEPGTYYFQCDPHARIMNGDFVVV